jgi:AraC family transcriptional regulator, regulatory protein of adaptative response / DNA-3-methyladenine glycosylase II
VTATTRDAVVSLPSDFDSRWTLAFLAARSVAPLERVDADRYERVVRVGGRVLTLSCGFERGPGRGRRLRLRSRPSLPASRLRGLGRRLFDLETDLRPFRRLARRDRVLRELVSARRTLRVVQFLDPFEALVRAVLGQQVSVAGARTLAGRLVALANGGSHFPTAAELAGLGERRLRGIGLTRARARCLFEAARAVRDGAVRWDALRSAPTEEAERTLRELPGVGPWTASYVLMRGLGHRDAFPAGDLGVRKALEAVCGPRLRVARAMEIAEAWRPFRAYATLHLWASLSRKDE